MATFSANLSLIEPTPGDPATLNVWGGQLNTNFQLIDSAITGILTLSVAAGGTIVLTSVQGQPDQSRNVTFNLTGVLPNNTTVLWPQGLARNFRVINQTTGAHTLTVGANNGMGSAAGTTFVVPQDGTPYALASDGTNIAPWLGGYLPLTGGTLTGDLLISEPTNANFTINSTAVSTRNIRYQTNLNNRWVLVTTNAAESGANVGSNFAISRYSDAGGFIDNPVVFTRSTGVAAFSATPTFPTVATGDATNNGATTAYVVNEVIAYTAANYLPLSGGTINGSLNISQGNLSVFQSTGTVEIDISGAAGNARFLNFETAGLPRWQIVTTGAAESGGNAGSNFSISRFDDSGTLISNAIFINRATGVSNFSVTPTFPTTNIGDSSTSGATTAFVQQCKPISFSTNTPVTGTNAFVTVASITFSISTSRAFIVQGNIFQGFFTPGNWGMRMVLDGVPFDPQVNSSSIPQSVASIMGYTVVPSGTHTIALQWLGQNSSVVMSVAAISAQLTN